MVQSPYTFKTMAKTTPMTAAMEMYHWLHDKFPKKKSFQEEQDTEEAKVSVAWLTLDPDTCKAGEIPINFGYTDAI